MERGRKEGRKENQKSFIYNDDAPKVVTIWKQLHLYLIAAHALHCHTIVCYIWLEEYDSDSVVGSWKANKDRIG